MTRLLFVRHGESTWNAESRWQGHADAPLSGLGERQALAAAKMLAEWGDIRAVWTSDLIRAHRTASLVAARLGIERVQVDARLRERDVGEWTGLTRADINERWPGYLESRRSPPGFEPDTSVLERVLAALRTVVEAEAGDVLVITHGGVVRTVERHLGAEPRPVANLAGRWVVAEDGELTLGERLMLIDPHDVVVTLPRAL
jgi:broad specificity phosphatase PhoE